MADAATLEAGNEPESEPEKPNDVQGNLPLQKTHFGELPQQM